MFLKCLIEFLLTKSRKLNIYNFVNEITEIKKCESGIKWFIFNPVKYNAKRKPKIINNVSWTKNIFYIIQVPF
jgi:hypothetical protein